MSLAQEMLRRLILQRLASVDIEIDRTEVFEAGFDKLKQIHSELINYEQEKFKQKQLVESLQSMDFKEAIKVSEYKNVVLTKWAQSRFKEFFVKQSCEGKKTKDLYAQTSTGNLFIWDPTSEKWKKVK